MKHILCLTVLTTFLLCRVHAQQSVYYEKARDLYKAAAGKTKCPDRAAVLMEYSNWNQCMVDELAGRTTNCAASISTPIPPCDADASGSGSSSGQTAGSSNDQTQGVNNAVAAIGNGILNIIQNGQAKRNSITGALTKSLAQNLYNNKINLNCVHSTVCTHCQGTGWTKEGDFDPIPCAYCNGLGKLYVSNDFYNDANKADDPNHPATSALVKYLNECQSQAEIYNYTLDGYKGSTSLRVTNDFYFKGNFLVIFTTYMFKFLKSNGTYDIYASLNNPLYDCTVIPLTDILGVSSVPGITKTFDQNSMSSDTHFALSAADGENVEFQSANSNLMGELMDLINKAKIEQSK